MLAIEQQAGRALDAVIAERLFGWTWKEQVVFGQSFRNLYPPEGAPTPSGYGPGAGGDRPFHEWGWDLYPQYSTSLDAAWLVVDKLTRTLDARMDRFKMWQSNVGFWFAQFGDHSNGPIAHTPASAVCLAALEALDAL